MLDCLSWELEMCGWGLEDLLKVIGGWALSCFYLLEAKSISMTWGHGRERGVAMVIQNQLRLPPLFLNWQFSNVPKQGKDHAFAILQMWPEKNFSSFFFIHFWFKCYGKCSKKDFSVKMDNCFLTRIRRRRKRKKRRKSRWILHRFKKNFFWNFQKCKEDLCYILIDKQMLEKVFCSNIAPYLSSRNHLNTGQWHFSLNK